MTEATPTEEQTTTEVLDSADAGGRIIRGGAMRTISYGAGILVGLISTPIMVRHLGDTQFGQYVTVNSLIFVVTGITEGGLAAVAVREFAADDADQRHTLMRNLLGLRIVLFVLGTIGAIGFSLAAGYDQAMVVGALVACVGMAFSALYGVCTVPLTARLRQGALSSLDLLRQVLMAVLVIALALAGAGLVPFFVAGAVGAIVAAVIAVVITRADVPLRPHADLAQWKRLLTQSIPYGVATAFSILYFRVAIILMSVVSTAQETGFYGLAFRVVELVTGVPYLLVFVAFPLLARAAGTSDDTRLAYALQRMFEVALILGVTAAIGVGIGAPFAIKVLGGADFQDSVTPLVVLGTAVIGTFLVSTWSYALLSLKHYKVLVIANGTAVLAGTVLTIVLAAPYGALGAAIATATTEIGLGLAYGVILSRLRPDLRPRLKVVPPLLLAAAVALAVPLLLGLPSLPGAILAVVLCLGILQLLGAIPREVVDAVRRARA